jgi:hypothetical protein
LNLYLVVIIIVVFVIIPIVVVPIVVSKIPLRVMNESEPVVGHFEEKVSYPEIKVTIDVNPFVANWQVLENNSVRHVNQHIADSTLMPEKMTVVYVVPVMIMYKERWLINKPANYVAPSRVVEIMPVEPVRVWMVGVVIIYPAVKIPAIPFPTSVPVIIISVIVVPVEIFIAFPVVRTVRSSAGVPVFFTASVVFTGSVPSVIFVQTVNAPVVAV